MSTNTNVINSFNDRRSAQHEAELRDAEARRDQADKRTSRAKKGAIGATALAAAVLGGQFFGNKAVDSVEQQTVVPSVDAQNVAREALADMGREVPATDQANTTNAELPTDPRNLTVTVEPGDTPWGIASEHQQEGDIRPLVQDIAEQAGDDGLQPGETIIVPSNK